MAIIIIEAETCLWAEERKQESRVARSRVSELRVLREDGWKSGGTGKESGDRGADGDRRPAKRRLGVGDGLPVDVHVHGERWQKDASWEDWTSVRVISEVWLGGCSSASALPWYCTCTVSIAVYNYRRIRQIEDDRGLI